MEFAVRAPRPSISSVAGTVPSCVAHAGRPQPVGQRVGSAQLRHVPGEHPRQDVPVYAGGTNSTLDSPSAVPVGAPMYVFLAVGLAGTLPIASDRACRLDGGQGADHGRGVHWVERAST
ncbi:hypothetical protein F4677DRAFT_443874 [Hypoxylon crocopeplum]|nr:hypothetical protein F4677DRAFT_443874 [Hypoxylon crocopeplum]